MTQLVCRVYVRSRAELKEKGQAFWKGNCPDGKDRGEGFEYFNLLMFARFSLSAAEACIFSVKLKQKLFIDLALIRVLFNTSLMT